MNRMFLDKHLLLWCLCLSDLCQVDKVKVYLSRLQTRPRKGKANRRGRFCAVLIHLPEYFDIIQCFLVVVEMYFA